MHNLILGMTGTGKTALAVRLSLICRDEGIPRIILDPDLRREWQVIEGKDFITDDPEKFLAYCKENERCALFIDEGGNMIGLYSGEMAWVATNSRKWGHKAYFITQRATQLDKNIRSQCTSVFIFQQGIGDCKLLAEEYNRPLLMEAVNLKLGEYVCKIGVDGQVKRGKAW